MRDLTTHTRPLSDLRQFPNNARNGDVELIAESLAVNQQFKPIVTTVDGTILAGSHTYQAALSLGWESLDAVILDVDPGSVEAKRIVLADNRTSDQGASRYDDGLLLALLESLDGDLIGTGYADYDVSDLAGDVPEPFAVAHTSTCPECGHEW